MMCQNDGEQRLKDCSEIISKMTISELVELMHEVTGEIESRIMLEMSDK